MKHPFPPNNERREFQREPQPIPKFLDERLSVEERKKSAEEAVDKMMNPIEKEKFNPSTFDPTAEMPGHEFVKRDRKDPPRRLPTMGLKPKEVREGQMIGMYESKQDLYLMIAALSERVSDLEDSHKVAVEIIEYLQKKVDEREARIVKLEVDLKTALDQLKELSKLLPKDKIALNTP